MAAKAETCTRCGAFLGPDARTIQGRAYCLVCAERPEVNYLAAFRRSYEGRRDALAWLALPAGLTNIDRALGARHWTGAVSLLVLGLLEVAFFARQRWSRWGLLPAQCAVAASSIVVAAGPAEGGQAMGRAISTLVFTTLVLFNARNRLFFRLPVSETELARVWNVYENNSPARVGFALGVVSLVVWPFAVLALPLSLVGLSRVNPTATPPIGRRRQAIAGMVCSVIGLVAMAIALISVMTSATR